MRRLESWIEQLVEEPFVRLFAGRLLPQEVAKHLVLAMEDGETLGADGKPEAPGRYCLALNPEDLTALQRYHPDLESQLAQALKLLATHIQLRLHEPPALLLHADPTVPLRTVRITPADRIPVTAEQTRDLDLERLQTLLTAQHREETTTRAYLIVDGGRVFDLNSAVVHLGRSLDNDLIVEDRRVSRHHAQLRSRYGRYILQDMGSSGGTLVNGFPVQEIVLRPGDCISLAGVEIIYAEETVARREKNGDTQPFIQA